MIRTNLDEILRFAKTQEEPNEVFKDYQWYRNQIYQGKLLICQRNTSDGYMQKKHEIAFQIVKDLYQ